MGGADRGGAPLRRGARRTGRPTTDRPPGPDGPPLPIVTRGLTKRYGDLVAVDHLDLEVHAGEIFGLLGQNGAGKTTTILMLLGLTEPSEGTASVGGLDPAREPLDVKRRVGYMPDAVGFYGTMTGRQNLRYTARLNGIDGPDGERRISEALEQVGLADRADSRTDTYSRGMLQRLGIADALLKDPEVLILDEPTTAIDPLGVVEMLGLFRSLARDRGIAILLSSHLLNQVQSTCDRVGIFAAGRLIGTGTVDELAAQFDFPVSDVEIVVDLPADAAAAVEAGLRAIEGVTDVAPGPDGPGATWVVSTAPAADTDAILRAAVEAVPAGSLVAVGRRHVALEAIYRRALERQAAEVAPSATDGEVAA